MTVLDWWKTQTSKIDFSDPPKQLHQPYSKNVPYTQQFHQDSHQIKINYLKFILKEQMVTLLTAKARNIITKSKEKSSDLALHLTLTLSSSFCSQLTAAGTKVHIQKVAEEVNNDICLPH